MKEYCEKMSKIIESMANNQRELEILNKEYAKLSSEFVNVFRENMEHIIQEYKELEGLQEIYRTHTGFELRFQEDKLPTAKGLTIIEDLTGFFFISGNYTKYSFNVCPSHITLF